MNHPRPLSDVIVCILCMLVIMVAIPFVICALIAFTLADHLERALRKPGKRHAQR